MFYQYFTRGFTCIVQVIRHVLDPNMEGTLYTPSQPQKDEGNYQTLTDIFVNAQKLRLVILTSLLTNWHFTNSHLHSYLYSYCWYSYLSKSTYDYMPNKYQDSKAVLTELIYKHSNIQARITHTNYDCVPHVLLDNEQYIVAVT